MNTLEIQSSIGSIYAYMITSIGKCIHVYVCYGILIIIDGLLL